MKATYTTPLLEEIGGVATLTAAFGSSTRVDFSEFNNERGQGSFDVCDENRDGPSADPDFCEG